MSAVGYTEKEEESLVFEFVIVCFGHKKSRNFVRLEYQKNGGP